jgi:hypothetical protein
MKFRDNKIATARREGRKKANRAVRRARRLYIEDSAN